MLAKSIPGVMAQWYNLYTGPWNLKTDLGSNSFVCSESHAGQIRSAVVFPKERKKMMAKNHAEQEL